MTRHKTVYNSNPIMHRDNIPVFSLPNKYIHNYEKIAHDHLEHMHMSSDNPFIQEEIWNEMESSTMRLINKYIKSEDCILDVGVGTGRVLDRYVGYQRYGIDIALEYLKISSEKGIDVCLAMAEDMPYVDNMFDIVVCMDVLEHVIDLNAVCKNILRVTKEGGVIIIRVPYKEDLKNYLDKEYPYMYAHLRSFDEYSLRILFERIFKCEVLEWRAETYLINPYYMRGPKSLIRIKWLFSKMIEKAKRLNVPGISDLIQMMFSPIEINLVVKKTYTEVSMSCG